MLFPTKVVKAFRKAIDNLSPESTSLHRVAEVFLASRGLSDEQTETAIREFETSIKGLNLYKLDVWQHGHLIAPMEQCLKKIIAKKKH